MIKDLLKNKKHTVSFEVFPPKEDYLYDGVVSAVTDLCALSPDFISVTYGAGGSSSRNTAKIASLAQNKLNTTTLAHLTCISLTRKDVQDITGELAGSNVKNILALRGDIPKNEADIKHHYHYAHELIADIKKTNKFCIGGACYPEGHVECKDLDADAKYLKMKQDAGCDFLITQLYFDNQKLYEFKERAAKHGVTIPVIAGLMPVQNTKQIKKMCALSGAEIPPKLRALLDKYADSPSDLQKAGIAYVVEQSFDLYQNGTNNIHIYTMNKPALGKAIIESIRQE